MVETGDLVPATDLLRRIGEVPGLARIMERLQMAGSESLGQAAAALEFALEGLYLMRRLSKDSHRRRGGVPDLSPAARADGPRSELGGECA